MSVAAQETERAEGAAATAILVTFLQTEVAAFLAAADSAIKELSALDATVAHVTQALDALYTGCACACVSFVCR